MSKATGTEAGPKEGTGAMRANVGPPDPDDYYEPDDTDEVGGNLMTVDQVREALGAIGEAPAARPIVAEGGPTTLAKFLDLPEAEMRAIDLRIGLAKACRRIRTEAKVTQAEAARRLGVSQPRVAEAENLNREPTLDALIPLFFAVGGTSDQLCELVKATDRSMSR